MFDVNAVDKALLTLTNTLVDKVGEATEYDFDCNFVVTCSGGQYGDTKEGDEVHVTGAKVRVWDSGHIDEIWVGVEEQIIIYGDDGFAAAMSRALGMEVDYTESGMQTEGTVSME